jgi:hypothetical protein
MVFWANFIDYLEKWQKSRWRSPPEMRANEANGILGKLYRLFGGRLKDR